MPELVSLKELPMEVKVAILEELGYGTDGVYVVDKNKQRHIDKYIKEPVRLDNMLILPGSTIIIDDNPLSISSYLEEFGDVL